MDTRFVGWFVVARDDSVVTLVAAFAAVLWDAPVIPQARRADAAQESATSRVGR